MMGTQQTSAAFRSAEAAATYDTRIPRRVPGYHLASDLASSAIRARHGSVASVAVVGSGTGAEIVALAQNAPGWTFTAIEPSEEMTAIAREKIAENGFADRVVFVSAAIEDAPSGAHDAALVFLVSHFIPDDGSRAQFFEAVARQLAPGGTLLTYEAMDTGPFDPAFLDWLSDQGLTVQEAEDTLAHIGKWSRLTPSRLSEILDETGFTQSRSYLQVLGFAGVMAKRTG